MANIRDDGSRRAPVGSARAQSGRPVDLGEAEGASAAADAREGLARRKLARRALWIAPALAVGFTLTRTAAATVIDPCQPGDPDCE